MSKIEISIGDKNFIYHKENILTNWTIKDDIKIKNEKEYICLQSPSNLRYKTSLIPSFSLIINWQGDFYIIWKSLLHTLLLFLIPSIICIIIFYSLKLLRFVFNANNKSDYNEFDYSEKIIFNKFDM